MQVQRIENVLSYLISHETKNELEELFLTQIENVSKKCFLKTENKYSQSILILFPTILISCIWTLHWLRDKKISEAICGIQ